jgi:hypothetical protein
VIKGLPKNHVTNNSGTYQKNPNPTQIPKLSCSISIPSSKVKPREHSGRIPLVEHQDQLFSWPKSMPTTNFSLLNLFHLSNQWAEKRRK